MVKNFDHLEKLKFSKVAPKAFTEKGLYMLATILKSQVATETSIEINLAVLKFKHTIKHKNDNNEVREPEPIYITLQNKDLNDFQEEN